MGVDLELQIIDVNTYKSEFLPSYQAFRDRGDVRPMAQLLRQVLDELPTKSSQLENLDSIEVYQNDLDILEGREFYAPGAPAQKTSATLKTSQGDLKLYVQDNVAPNVAYILCSEVRPNIPNTIDISRSPLIKYLYKYSKWIESTFTFSTPPKGPYLEVPLGESTQILTREEVERLYREVRAVPRPANDSSLQKQYDDFVNFLKTALDDQNLAVALSVR